MFSGSTRKPEKFPADGNRPYLAFKELYRIKAYLQDPNLTIRLTFLNMEEYKLLNGWSRDKKRGSSRYDRIPVSIEREMEFTCAQDYVQLIPYDLPEPFTSAQLAKAVQIRKEQAGIVCNILHDLGVMKREGKKGNAYLYRVVEV